MFYIKSIFLTVLIILMYSTAFSQDALLQLQFESAEKAFNEGNYTEALKKVDEVENKAGVTSKTLYLRIVSQDKLIESDLTGHFDLIKKLKMNTDKYLEALKEQEIDDKYRKVYEISQKVKDYPTDKAAVSSVAVVNPVFIKDATVGKVINAYWRAVGGNKSASIHSISMESESLTDKGNTIGQEAMKLGIDKYYSENKSGKMISQEVYHNGSGYINTPEVNYAALADMLSKENMKGNTSAITIEMTKEILNGNNSVLYTGKSNKTIITDDQLSDYKNKTKDGKSLLETVLGFDPLSFSQAEMEEGIFIGEAVFVAKVAQAKYYFSKKNNLLIGKEEENYAFTTKTVFADYTQVNGFLFPFTIITEIEYKNPMAEEQQVQEPEPEQKNEAEGTAAMGLFVKPKKKKPQKSNTLTTMRAANNYSSQPVTKNKIILKVKYIKINEPIPDEIFK